MWILQFASTFMTEMKVSPLNWYSPFIPCVPTVPFPPGRRDFNSQRYRFLSAVVIYLLHAHLSSTPTTTTIPSCQPETVLFKDYTPRELAEFNGRQDSGNGKIYIAIQRRVFDVTAGRNFYGPEGPYGNFAGRDASRGLALNSFDKSILTDLDQPIDLLENLSEEEKGSLRDWFSHFATKYDHVGTLVNESSPMSAVVTKMLGKVVHLITKGGMITGMSVGKSFAVG